MFIPPVVGKLAETQILQHSGTVGTVALFGIKWHDAPSHEIFPSVQHIR